MRFLDLAFKDILQTMRDWKGTFFLLIMPLAFTLLFGFAFGGFGGEPNDPRLPVTILDQDQSDLSADLVALLENSAVIRIEPAKESGQTNESAVEQRVVEEEVAGAVIIPAGYGQTLRSGEAISIIVVADSGSNAGRTAQAEVQVLAGRLQSAVRSAAISQQTYAAQRPFTDETEEMAYFDRALELALAAWQQPPLIVKVNRTASGEEESDLNDNAFAQSSPGMMLQFAIAGLIGAAEVLVLERKSGSLRRLMTTAITRVEILFGHYLAMFLLVFIQLFVLLTFGQIFLKLEYYSALAATLLVTISTALFVASLGLLIGALAKKSEQVIIFALLPMFIFAGLGGAWFPLEFTSETVQAIGHLTPVAWAMDGYQNILLRGQGLESVLISSAVLLLYALVFGALAVWRFRFD